MRTLYALFESTESVSSFSEVAVCLASASISTTQESCPFVTFISSNSTKPLFSVALLEPFFQHVISF